MLLFYWLQTYRFRRESRNNIGGTIFHAISNATVYAFRVVRYYYHYPVIAQDTFSRPTNFAKLLHTGRYMMSKYFQLTNYTKQLTNEGKELNEMIIIIIIINIISRELRGGYCV